MVQSGLLGLLLLGLLVTFILLFLVNKIGLGLTFRRDGMPKTSVIKDMTTLPSGNSLVKELVFL